ncbi:ATG3 [Symbiodinium natans]|uniref:ATG3 protein n=1 Tax=Symbiodinium natans TaxID=878477 RepID=A0A812USJ7_9DINO|nr:ATG3 [Symbiodinium natans]
MAMEQLSIAKHRLGDALRSTVNAFTTAGGESKFVESGTLTPEEFVEAGDQLTFKFPTWRWESGEASLRASYLPQEQQYLITRNVPCRDRVRALDFALDQTTTEDDWLLPPEMSSGAENKELHDVDDLGPSEGASKAEGKGIVFNADDDFLGGGAAASTLPDFSDLDQQLQEDDYPAAGYAAPSGGVVVAEAPDANIVKTRTYDLSITYDKYYRTPRLWLFGYNERGDPLKPEEVYEDVLSDYKSKTVTVDPHPLTGTPTVSIHPCQHAQVMKKVIQDWIEQGLTPRHDLALFVFLKFISSVVPTINYDFTMEIELLLRFLAGAGRGGRWAAVTALRKSSGRSRRTDDDWHRVLDYAIHHGLVRLEIVIGPENRKAFASPQLTDSGQRWFQTGPHNCLLDFGHAAPAGPAQRERDPSPATLRSVADPPSPGSRAEAAVTVTDDEEINTPEDDQPLANLQVLVEQRRVSSQPTPQRRRLGLVQDEVPEDATALQGQLAAEVAALQSLVANLSHPRAAALAAALNDVRSVRRALEAEVPSSAKRQRHSAGSISIHSSSPQSSTRPEAKSRRTVRAAGSPGAEELPLPAQPRPAPPLSFARTARPVAHQPGSVPAPQLQRPVPRAVAKAAASKKFSEREREGCSELIKKLMDAHDFNSNQQGGTEKFRQIINKVKPLAPVAKRPILEEVPQKYFLGKTPGKHRERLRQIITEFKAEGL